MLPDEKRAIRQISIHSPLAGRDAETINNEEGATIFQSTRPSRGETRTAFFMAIELHFNPLAPRGARRVGAPQVHQVKAISIHSPLAGRDTMAPANSPRRCRISIHSPLAGRDHVFGVVGLRHVISIHSPLAGRDRSRRTAFPGFVDFNPLAPRGARLFPRPAAGCPPGFQSTRPSRGETLASAINGRLLYISIHSPLAGRDAAKAGRPRPLRISIHSPLAGRDSYIQAARLATQFQSTRPSRGETGSVRLLSRSPRFQSTRPSRGETGQVVDALAQVVISIHSPLAGRDVIVEVGALDVVISIHSPLAGRDLHHRRRSGGLQEISIHSPLAGRDNSAISVPAKSSKFQSTRPSRGETLDSAGFRFGLSISIHSPLAGRDAGGLVQHRALRISIHSPLAGRDADRAVRHPRAAHFNPLAPRGARQPRGMSPARPQGISIHSPLAGRDLRPNRTEPTGP